MSYLYVYLYLESIRSDVLFLEPLECCVVKFRYMDSSVLLYLSRYFFEIIWYVNISEICERTVVSIYQVLKNEISANF
jgi:hypothetical protein